MRWIGFAVAIGLLGQAAVAPAQAQSGEQGNVCVQDYTPGAAARRKTSASRI